MRGQTLALTLLLGACGGASQAGPPVHAAAAAEDGDALPDGAFVQETYRFALTPTPGWELLEADAVRTMNVNASAAMHALDDDTGWGMVMVEHLVGVGLDDAVQLMLDGIALEDARLVSDERVRFADRPARRFVVEGALEGMPLRFEYVLFISRDHLYTLAAWQGTGSGRDLSPFFDAFVLLPGQIGEAVEARVLEATGALWRVHEGRYENLASALQVDAPTPWTLVVGDALSGINPEADVGFHVASPDIWGLVLSERVPPESYDRMHAFLSQSTIDNAGGQVVRRDTLPLLGESVPANVMHSRGLEMTHAVRCAEERCVQLLVWYPIAAAAEARSLFREAFPRVAPLSDPEALAAALRASQRERREIGPHHTLRGRRYTDFAHGLIVEVPEDGHWQFWAEAEARQLVESDNVDLYLFDPVASLHAMLVVEPLAEPLDADTYHRDSVRVIGLPETPAEETRLGSLPAHVSEADASMELGAMRWVVHTTVANGVGYRLVFWGWPEHVRAGRDQIRELVRTLSFTGSALPHGQMQGDGTWVDHRLGFRLPLPGPGWESRDVTPPRLAGPAGLRLFSRGDEVVMVVVVDPGPSGGTERAASIREVTQLVVRRFAQREEGTRELPPMRWLGRDAQHFVMPSGMHALITHDGQQVYAMLTQGVDLEAVSSGFQLTP
ncbi:MAG: hypothetical protein RLP09_40355 [Sandaracinaceae bacterium]|nr:hypothetical protein [Myxococcales bacterium]